MAHLKQSITYGTRGYIFPLQRYVCRVCRWVCWRKMYWWTRVGGRERGTARRVGQTSRLPWEPHGLLATWHQVRMYVYLHTQWHVWRTSVCTDTLQSKLWIRDILGTSRNCPLFKCVLYSEALYNVLVWGRTKWQVTCIPRVIFQRFLYTWLEAHCVHRV